MFSVFDSLTVTSNGLGDAQGQVLSTDLSSPMNATLAPAGAGRTATSPLIAAGITFGPATNLSPAGLMPLAPAGVTITPVSTGLMSQQPAWSTAQPVVNAPTSSEHSVVLQRTDHGNVPVPFVTRPRTGLVPDSVLDELASDAVLRARVEGGRVGWWAGSSMVRRHDCADGVRSGATWHWLPARV